MLLQIKTQKNTNKLLPGKLNSYNMLSMCL